MRSNMLVEEYQEVQIVPLSEVPPRPPGPSAVVISWKKDEWELLKLCKEYVKANPDDIPNKLVYRNLLRYYSRD